MTQPQDTQSHVGTGRRKKLTTIVFDTDFFIRPRTRLLIRRAGSHAPLVYLAAICWAAYEHSTAVFPLESVALLSLDLEIEESEVLSALKACCLPEIGYLRAVDGGFASERLEGELRTVQTKQENYRSGAAKRNQAKTRKDSQESSRILENPQECLKMPEVRKEQEQEKEQEEEQEQEQEPRSSAPLPAATNDDPETWSEYRREAEQALQPVTHEIARSKGFVQLGRRPMKKYPELWLTGIELESVTLEILDAGLTLADRPKVFAKAVQHAKQKILEGKDPSTLRVVDWLTGFCLREVLETISTSNRMISSELYVKKARRA